jgi:hypothetical protein
MISVEARFITVAAQEDAHVLSGLGALAPAMDDYSPEPRSWQSEGTEFIDEIVNRAAFRNEQRSIVLDDEQVDRLLRNSQQILTASLVDSPRLVVFNAQTARATTGGLSYPLLRVVETAAAGPPEPRQLAAPVFGGREINVTPTLSPDGRRVTLALDAVVSDPVEAEPGVPILSKIPLLKRTYEHARPTGKQGRVLLKADVPLGRTLLVRTPMVSSKVKGLRRVRDARGHDSYEIVRNTTRPTGKGQAFLYVLVKPSIHSPRQRPNG